MMLPPVLQLNLNQTDVACFGTAPLETMHIFNVSFYFIFFNHYIFSKLFVGPVGQGHRGPEWIPADIRWE